MIWMLLGLGASSTAVYLWAAARSKNRKWRRALRWSVALVAGATVAALATALRVVPGERTGTDGVVVYVGMSDPAYVNAARDWTARHVPGARSVTLVGVSGAAGLLSAAWPGAEFEPAPAEWTHGIGLEQVAEDLERRLAREADLSVVIVGPRTQDLSLAGLRLGSVLEAHPGLADRTHFLLPGCELPEAPRPIIRAPAELSGEADHWPVSVRVESGEQRTPARVEMLAYDPSRRDVVPVRVDAGGTLTTGVTGEASLPRGGSLVLQGNGPMPRTNDASVMYVEVGSRWETWAADQVFCNVTRPQFAVLGGPGVDPVLRYMELIGLDVRRIDLDLSSRERATQNAEKLGDYPVLVVAAPLTEEQLEVLTTSVAAQKPSATLLFVGGGRGETQRSGWAGLRPLRDLVAPVSEGAARRVALVWDNSGSMDQAVGPGMRSRMEVVRSLITRFQQGLAQRDTGFIDTLVERDRRVSVAPIGGITEFARGTIEAGPTLTHFASLIRNGTSAYSDLVIFLDPADLDFSDTFTREQVEAARRLVVAGCRVTLVSVGGPLAGQNEDDLEGMVQLRMTDYSSEDALDAALENLLYNQVLPVMSVASEPAGGTRLDAMQRKMLTDAAAATGLRLIDAGGQLALESEVSSATRRQVLLWAALGGRGRTPLLTEGMIGGQPALWLTTSLNAEAAARLRNDSSEAAQDMRRGLSGLFVAALHAANPRVKLTPVTFMAEHERHALNAVIDTYQPFRLRAQSVKQEGIDAGVMDDRDLGVLRWTLGGRSEAREVATYDVLVHDGDERIGLVQTSIRFMGKPPTLLATHDMVALQSVLGVEPQARRSAPDTRGIPRSVYPFTVMGALLLVIVSARKGA